MNKFERPLVNKRVLLFYILLSIALYVFFRYVHPVVPWDGDDWRTIGTNLSCFEHGLPQFGLMHKESERIMCSLFGGFFGYIAAFIIYPITKDYIASFVITTACCLAISITTVAYFVFKLFKSIDKSILHVYLAVAFFLISGFVIFKNTYPSTYLFWQFNYCTVYYYSIPSYLASAFDMYLINKYISNTWFEFNAETGILLVALYFLIFSFLPAALLIAAASFSICLMVFLKNKSIKHLIYQCWFHIISLILFFLKVFFEFFSEFGSGYFSQPTNILKRLKDSLIFLLSTFIKMNYSFKLFAIFIIAITLVLFIKRCFKNGNENNAMFRDVFSILFISLLLVFFYFLFFGIISFGHLYKGNLPVRMDSMYVLYFLIIIFLDFCIVYILNNIRELEIFFSFAITVMVVTMISPANHYSDSFYTDTTPNQRYVIMSKIIDEVKIKNAEGADSLIVYMPAYNHYGGPGMAYDLYLHNITDRKFEIEFNYEENIEDVYFE